MHVITIFKRNDFFKTRYTIFYTYLILICFFGGALEAQVPMGRLAYIADGNYRDTDDIGGSAVGLAILRAKGHEKNVVHFSHSCDLVKATGDKGGSFREVEMQKSHTVTAEKWGGFEHIKKFYNAFSETDSTIADLARHINNSTATDPLWIIEAGEPDILVRALIKSEPTKRKFVHIISHHTANDVGDAYDLKDVFPLGLTEATNIHRIPDQNTLLKKPLADFEWAKNHKDTRINWLYDRALLSQTSAMQPFPTTVGYADISDAGMVWYWSTLNEGGDQNGNFSKLKLLLESFVQTGIRITPRKNGLDSHILVYPNPVSSILNIETDVYLKNKIKIISNKGDLVYSTQTNSTKTQIDIKSLNLKGVVLVQVITDDVVNTNKVLVN